MGSDHFLEFILNFRTFQAFRAFASIPSIRLKNSGAKGQKTTTEKSASLISVL